MILLGSGEWRLKTLCCSEWNRDDEAMERENTSSMAAVNDSRLLWPVIGDADLLPDGLSHGLKLTFVVAYATIILMALGGNGLMMINKDWSVQASHRFDWFNELQKWPLRI